MEKNFEYDVFISYKRRGGTPWAELLFLALNKIARKRVFIDRHRLKGGMDKKWESTINKAIESSINVVVVVFSGIQDVINENDDFFITEISKALDERTKRRLNIIPFYVEGLSSEVIHSNDQYKELPDELKTITSPDYEDTSFDSKHPYAWIDDLVSKALISEADILEEYCYRVQVTAREKMIVYDSSVSAGNNSKNKIRKLNHNGADTIYWIEKNGGYLVLSFEADKDNSQYEVTIDTKYKNESKTPRESSAYYNIKDGTFPSDGIFRMDGNTIFLTINWEDIRAFRINKAFVRTVEKSMSSHSSHKNELPLIDGLLNIA